MNINFHYFMIKTLACLAGFKEDEAQTIAYASQFVDDFIPEPMYTDIKPPQFFFGHGMAGTLSNRPASILGGKYRVSPLPTGIPTASLSLVQENFHKKTIAPFHFMPPASIDQIMADIKAGKCDRKRLRCISCETIHEALIAYELKEFWRDSIQSRIIKKVLIKFGMLLHIFADTFSHEGFSGLHGWENHAEILSTFSVKTPNVNIPCNATLYHVLPSIGHANIGHLPDVGAFSFSYKRRKSESDNYADAHKRDNKDTFLKCAGTILLMLHAFKTKVEQKSVVEKIYNQNADKLTACIVDAHRVGTSDDNENLSFDELTIMWSKYFPQIMYYYNTATWLGKTRRSADDEMVTITDENAIQEILQFENEWKYQFGIPDSDSESVKRGDGIIRRGGTIIPDELYAFMELTYRHSVYVNTGKMV